ncbi:MAG: hypothetical protein GEV08_21105 [Acidimicrobiia bacterium]|nr:hypothetical protein [Acidimicrobiia bacterium]
MIVHLTVTEALHLFRLAVEAPRRTDDEHGVLVHLGQLLDQIPVPLDMLEANEGVLSYEEEARDTRSHEED